MKRGRWRWPPQCLDQKNKGGWCCWIFFGWFWMWLKQVKNQKLTCFFSDGFLMNYCTDARRLLLVGSSNSFSVFLWCKCVGMRIHSVHRNIITHKTWRGRRQVQILLLAQTSWMTKLDRVSIQHVVLQVVGFGYEVWAVSSNVQDVE